jgi:hypothetical protein
MTEPLETTQAEQPEDTEPVEIQWAKRIRDLGREIERDLEARHE